MVVDVTVDGLRREAARLNELHRRLGEAIRRRSGYEKADVMRRPANHGRLLSTRQRVRLREAVIQRIVHPEPRLTAPA